MRQLTIRFNLRDCGVGTVAVYGAVLKLHGSYIDSDSPVTWAPIENFTVHAVEFLEATGAEPQSSAGWSGDWTKEYSLSKSRI